VRYIRFIIVEVSELADGFDEAFNRSGIGGQGNFVRSLLSYTRTTQIVYITYLNFAPLIRSVAGDSRFPVDWKNRENRDRKKVISLLTIFTPKNSQLDIRHALCGFVALRDIFIRSFCKKSFIELPREKRLKHFL
jgi:hypothetical protein